MNRRRAIGSAGGVAALAMFTSLWALPARSQQHGGSPARTVTALAAGGYGTCGWLGDQSLRCWGIWNCDTADTGRCAHRPMVLRAMPGVRQLALGAQSCVRMEGGGVRCYDASARFAPLFSQPNWASVTSSPDVSLDGVVDVAAGNTHACAAMSDGTLRCWGDNALGELGDGTSDTRAQPVSVTGIANVVHVAVGAGHTCAVTRDGGVSCWGSNESQQLGAAPGPTRCSSPLSPSPVACARTPVRVEGIEGATQIAVGRTFSCALMGDGSARCWGANRRGQLGDGTTQDRASPVAVVGLSGAVQLVAAEERACARLGDGSVRCWGENSAGQLGDGSMDDRAAPVAVVGLSDATDVELGFSHACALARSGSVRCWGDNAYGQLGSGSTRASRRPALARW